MDADPPSYGVKIARRFTHDILICTRCPTAKGHTASDLQVALRALLSTVSKPVFNVRGVACMAGCDRPLTVGFAAAGKAAYLFGDLDPSVHAADLAAFASLYASLPDGWCNEGMRPPALAGKTLARIPAARGGDAT